MRTLGMIGVLMVMASGCMTPTVPTLHIPIEEYKLDNGLQVVLHRDSATPLAHVEIWYHVGSKDEPQGRSGFAHLFEHLMFNGSQHADGEYFAPLQPFGARINGTTNTDRTNYYETVPSNVLERALWMEADRMGFLLPALTQAKLDNQRDVVRNERRQNYEIAPYAKARQVIAEAVWDKNHPYHRLTIGSHEEIEAANLDDVSGFFNAWYAPNNATLVVSGDFDPVQTKEWIQKFFGPIAKGAAPAAITSAKATLPEAQTIELEDNVQLPRVYYTWQSAPFLQTGDADLDVLSLILSNGKTSRLYKRLVYDDRIAKDVYAAQYSSQLGSTYRIVATAAPGKDIADVQKAIDEEVAILLRDGPTDEEVERAKNAWKKSFFQSIESVAGKAGMLHRYNHYLGKTDWVADDLKRYMNITKESVSKWARTTIVAKHRVTVIVKPQQAAKEASAAKAGAAK
ncbi:MAG: insulinase family protein [Deltaproteobacteria bacterium]|nr:insulinase family protein [Deltaproteobacteria bacterium]MBT6433710.1 insulinase family protein [Deltaproteobacteria bacterium]MBT6488938.1 insulinase family protein [Deltaproteobacteria bacterium]